MACDQHVVKMITESVQMLSTAHHILRPGHAKKHDMYRPTHVNHPCNVWIREDDANYRWLFNLLVGYIAEYNRRFEQPQKFERARSLLPALEYSPTKVRSHRTPATFALAVNKYPECIDKDPVLSYRRFYLVDKGKFARWNHCKPPEWFTYGMEQLQHGVELKRISLI